MLFNRDKRTCTNPEEIANILQRQFISVFSDPSATNINDALFQAPSLEKPFNDGMLEFSVVDVVEAIDELQFKLNLCHFILDNHINLCHSFMS